MNSGAFIPPLIGWNCQTKEVFKYACVRKMHAGKRKTQNGRRLGSRPGGRERNCVSSPPPTEDTPLSYLPSSFSCRQNVRKRHKLKHTLAHATPRRTREFLVSQKCQLCTRTRAEAKSLCPLCVRRGTRATVLYPDQRRHDKGTDNHACRVILSSPR